MNTHTHISVDSLKKKINKKGVGCRGDLRATNTHFCYMQILGTAAVCATQTSDKTTP